MIKIQVTQKHIDQGHRFYSFECPVALACNDAGLRLTEVAYPASLPLEIAWGGRAERAVAPRSVQRFVRAYDNGRPVKPFTFILKAD